MKKDQCIRWLGWAGRLRHCAVPVRSVAAPKYLINIDSDNIPSPYSFLVRICRPAASRASSEPEACHSAFTEPSETREKKEQASQPRHESTVMVHGRCCW